MALSQKRRRFALELARLDDPRAAYAAVYSTKAVKPSTLERRIGALLAIPEIAALVAEYRDRAARARHANAQLRKSRLRKILDIRRAARAPPLAEIRAQRLAVVDSDPAGARVVHGINRRERRVDALLDDGVLSADQWTVANYLRDSWEAATPIRPPGAMPLHRVGGGPREPEIDEAARRRFERMLATLQPSKHAGMSPIHRRLIVRRAQVARQVVLDVVIFDGGIDEVSRARRCDAAAVLRRALDRINRKYRDG